jgi:hypothetical protein
MEKYRWTPEGTIIIPASKLKILVVFFGAFLFALGSVVVLEQIQANDFYSSIFIPLVCIIAIVFFGAIAFSSLQKLLVSSSIGLKIDSRGVEDHSSGVSIGFLPWDQIIDYQIIQVQTSRFILIEIQNPESLIEPFSGLKKFFLKANYKRYGTPVSISAAGLDCDFIYLHRIMEEAFQRYK